MLTDRSEPLKDKDDEFVKTSKKWFEQMSNSMAGYLRNTAKSAVNGDLESYIIMAIGKYLKLDNNVTLTDIYVSHILQRLGTSQSFGRELDDAFASVIIAKCGRSVLEELKKWTDDPHFKFPEWIMPGMRFVTETNLSKAVPLYDYINQMNQKMWLSSAIYDKNVPTSKVQMQALKACMEFQYMEENEEKKRKKKKRRNNKKESGFQNKKTKLDSNQYTGEKGRAEIGLTKKFQKLQKKDIVV
ncbi:hypothetical protein RhiirA4_474735 [Rhizophagus irregularis]|uniref:Uncharacterized protein n=1 Tax=Rhizophagus irregularis TaxID=588596 RepID=A0A2I1H8Z3_9GLOM|nr:hypothetical protein RhiirA4_474735 [Rhizophagus irregularis]